MYPMYDQYNAINSREIRKYQGSAIPELMQVSMEMQKRYDEAQNKQDLLNQFMSRLDALPQDKPMLNEWANKQREKLKGISQRPDLENTLRETNMLAQEVPAGYAPFAEAMKKRQEVEAAIDKRTDITQTEKEEAKRWAAVNYKGVRLDPETGRYKGSYTDYTPDATLDIIKFTKEALEKRKAHESGDSYEYTDGKWIRSRAGKRSVLDPVEIDGIVRSAFQSSPQAQSWLNMRGNYATMHIDWDRIKDENIPLDKPFGTQTVTTTDKKGKKVSKDVTLTYADVLKNDIERGIPPTQAYKNLLMNQEKEKWIRNASGYGQRTFWQNDVETKSGISGGDPYGVIEAQKKADDAYNPITAPILQPKNGFQYTNISDLLNAKDSVTVARKNANSDWSNWMSNPNNKITQTGPETNPNTRWYDSKGKDVTDEALRRLFALNQARTMEKQWEARINDVYKRANFSITPALQKEIEKAQTEALNSATAIRLSEMYTGVDLEQKLNLLKEDAKQRVITDKEGYKRVQKILEEDSKNGMQMIGITPLPSKAANTTITNLFTNLAVGLDTGGLDGGTLGLEWGSGDKPGTPLQAKDYKQIVGKTEFAGNGLVDGKIYMFFSVDNSTTNSKGERKGSKVLVRMPAFAGVPEAMIKTGQVQAVELMIADGVGRVTDTKINPAGFGEVIPNSGITVHKIPKSVSSISGAGMEDANYKISFPIGGGQVKEYIVNNPAEAINTIMDAYKNAVVKPK